MRWERLFDDLEARFEEQERAELASEVADRVRRERALITLQARLLAAVGQAAVSIRVPGYTVTGQVSDVGADWVLLAPQPESGLLIPFGAIQTVRGLCRRAENPSAVAKRITLGLALRGISRDRAPVQLTLAEGTTPTGTVDAVGADHIEFAVHAADQLRREHNVSSRDLVPFSAIHVVRRL